MEIWACLDVRYGNTVSQANKIVIDLCCVLQDTGAERSGRAFSTLGQPTEGCDLSLQPDHQRIPGHAGGARETYW